MFLLLTGALLPVALVAFPLSRPVLRAVSRHWFRGVLAICGLRLRVRGTPSAAPGTLYVGNHVSYLDIPVLGALLDAAFIAKEEVRGWPLFGLLARLNRTEFIRRAARDALIQQRAIAGRLGRGERLILFPEGTSSDGRRVLPFRSSLFAMADMSATDAAETAWVQPFSIAYTRYADGRPLAGGLQNHYAWHGEMDLLPHLLGMFGLKGAAVEVTFHEPARASAFAGRKALASHCQTRTAAGLGRSHDGRP